MQSVSLYAILTLLILGVYPALPLSYAVRHPFSIPSRRREYPYIYNVWKKQGWEEPIIIESFDPERIVLSLAIGVSGSKKVAIKTIAHKEAIIEYLTVN